MEFVSTCFPACNCILVVLSIVSLILWSSLSLGRLGQVEAFQALPLALPPMSTQPVAV